MYVFKIHKFIESIRTSAPGKPENFEAMVLSSTSIQLEWALPTETNGIIRGFKLRYENLTQNIGSSTNETLSANATLSYLLTGLERCTPYSFKLLAYTIKDGPYTDAIQRTTAENGEVFNLILFSQICLILKTLLD